MVSQVLLDGAPIAATDWRVSGVRDFFSGYRVMTTLLAIKNCLVDFDRHMERLNHHLERMEMGALQNPEGIRFEIEHLIQQFRFPEYARIRIIFFNDEAHQQHRICELIQESSLDMSMIQAKGVRLATIRDTTWERGSHIKTGIIGTRGVQILRAKNKGFDDVLWINGDGELAEATWSNIFLIGRTGDLVEIATPPPTSGILEGITRRRMMELLQSAKIPVTERVVTEEEIPRFDEAFVTSSIRGLVPVTQIAAHRLHSLRPQSVFQHIARLYSTWLKTNNSGGYSKPADH